MALIAVAEILDRVLRPLIRLRQKHPVLVLCIYTGTQPPQKLMRLRQILAVCSLTLKEVRDCIEPHSIDTHIQPELHNTKELLLHFGILEVQIRLMGIKTMPVIGSGNRIPGPVAVLEILKDNSRILILLGAVVPDIEIPLRGSSRRPAGPLKPCVLITGMIDYQLGYHLDIAGMGLAQQLPKII